MKIQDARRAAPLGVLFLLRAWSCGLYIVAAPDLELLDPSLCIVPVYERPPTNLEKRNLALFHRVMYRPPRYTYSGSEVINRIGNLILHGEAPFAGRWYVPTNANLRRFGIRGASPFRYIHA